MSGESAGERWSPAQSVESVLISILSLLEDPEVSSPANVDAGVMLRKKPAQYAEMVKKDTRASKNDVPDDFVMPTHEEAFKPKKEDDFMMSWGDSDVEDDFGGSDSDMPDEELDEELDEDDDTGNCSLSDNEDVDED